MEWNHNETDEQYEIYEDGELEAIIPEEVAGDVELVVHGLGRVHLSQLTLESSGESPSENEGLTRADMPDIPGRENLETQTDTDFYDRLVSDPGSQPAQYRRAIREHEQIDRESFDELAEEMGYNPGAGAHNASLLMLERIGEIERDGRGDRQTIRWIGE